MNKLLLNFLLLLMSVVFVSELVQSVSSLSVGNLVVLADRCDIEEPEVLFCI